MIHDEQYALPTRHWEVLAYKIYDDGTKEMIGAISHNVVVQNLSIALACLLKGHAGYGGLLYWAIGSGLGSWSESDPPAPSDTDTALAAETYRKAIPSNSIVFIGENNAVSAIPTNRLQASIVFGASEGNGKIMEFGLYAGNATAAAGSGLMINHKTHAAQTKTADFQLEYILRLVL